MTPTVSKDSKTSIQFSEPAEYDEDLVDLINDVRYMKYRIIDLHLHSQYTEEVDANLKDWKVESMTDTEIEISVEFKDPLQVSTGWEPD